MIHNDKISVKVTNIKKTFRLPHEQHSGIKQLLINYIKGIRGYEVQKVLNGVSFEIKKGEFFGIVGRNGSGKSTLLKLIAGIYKQDSGSILVNGSLTPFIELGVGFNPELTGRENIFLNGALLGFNNQEVRSMYDEIVNFAELENFMDQKLKNYSSGMQVRLAFSIAIRSKSDILLLDEVLAVGDANFQKKCFEVFDQFKKEGRTIILVTHDMNSVKSFCDRAILLSQGKIISQGNSKEVSDSYNFQNIEKKVIKESNFKNPIKINKITVTSPSQTSNNSFTPNDELKITLNCRALYSTSRPIIGITVSKVDGLKIFEVNTNMDRLDISTLDKGDYLKVDFRIQNILTDGEYIVTYNVRDEYGNLYSGENDRTSNFYVKGWDYTDSLTHPVSSVKIQINKTGEE